MTWTYNIIDDGSRMEVLDHNDVVVKELKNDGSGFKIPDDILSIMRNEAERARSNKDMERWRDIHIRLADNDIAPKE